MSRGKKHTGAGRPVPSATDQAMKELSDLLEQITAVGEDNAGPMWGQVHKALLKAKATPKDASRIVIGRNLEALKQQLGRMRGEAAPDQPEPAVEPTPEIPVETLKKAMKAFRRRLKLMKLDHESKLGVGPMTSGRSADFESILPPHQFEDGVWKTLARDGQLRSTGRGFYALPDG